MSKTRLGGIWNNLAGGEIISNVPPNPNHSRNGEKKFHFQLISLHVLVDIYNPGLESTALKGVQGITKDNESHMDCIKCKTNAISVLSTR